MVRATKLNPHQKREQDKEKVKVKKIRRQNRKQKIKD